MGDDSVIANGEWVCAGMGVCVGISCVVGRISLVGGTGLFSGIIGMVLSGLEEAITAVGTGEVSVISISVSVSRNNGYRRTRT